MTQKEVETDPDRIETKKLILVRLERYMNVDWVFRDHQVMSELKRDLFSRLDEIEGRAHPERYVGHRQMIRGPGESDRMYLAAAEVNSVENLPDGMVAKAFPASEYAIWNIRNGEEGLEKVSAWLDRSKYECNGAMNGDFEMFWLDATIDTHEYWFPIVLRRSGQQECGGKAT